MAQLMPLPLTVSCFSKIQIGFAFLVPAHSGSPGQRAVKRVCVCPLFRMSVEEGTVAHPELQRFRALVPNLHATEHYAETESTPPLPQTVLPPRENYHHEHLLDDWFNQSANHLVGIWQIKGRLD